MVRRRMRCALAVWLGLMSVMIATTGALADAPANDAFQRTWSRTDDPVATGQAVRTWMWGPEAFTGGLVEPYQESPDGQRTVQYFDKARMEITFPDDDQNSIWYVTNGLLVVELITGDMQTGHDQFEPHSPAEVNVAGDPDDPTGPTYATFAGLLDAPPAEPGEFYTERVNRDGTVGNRLNLAGQNVAAAVTDEETHHTIAEPFWAFMNSTGLVRENGGYTSAALFENAYFATGRPITEAYWARVQVAGTEQDVLLQCFERRCLTYTPENDPAWQVEAGNVGQHYYQWRYGDAPDPDPPAPDPPAPPPTDDESFSDGIWIVGEDIQPGIYRNSDSSDLCYWARLSGLGDTIDDIITNGISDARMIVEIAPSDVAFESSGCGAWSADQSPITTSPTSPFDDGTYFVNAEIAPGIWRNSGSDGNCYWERLSGFGGELDDIITNDFTTAHQVVEISADDTGFHTSGCGTWTLGANPVTSSLTADFGDGTFIVGTDIAAGVWQTSETVSGCYWARLDTFSGSILDIVENEFISDDEASSQPQQVTITPTDAGFMTEGCGVWTYLGP